MERVRIREDWWAGGRPWAAKYMSRRAWTVAPLYNMDDLLQEAWLCWRRCEEYYPHVLESRHFMALYMRTVINMVLSLAAARSRIPKMGDDAIIFTLTDSRLCMDEVERRWHLAEAPVEVKNVVRRFTGSRRPRFHRIRGVRETTNQYLSRLAGLNHTVDMVDRINNWWLGITTRRFR